MMHYRSRRDRDTRSRYRERFRSRVKNEEVRGRAPPPHPTDSSGRADAVDAEALRRTACGFLLVYRLFFARPNAPQIRARYLIFVRSWPVLTGYLGVLEAT